MARLRRPSSLAAAAAVACCLWAASVVDASTRHHELAYVALAGGGNGQLVVHKMLESIKENLLPWCGCSGVFCSRGAAAPSNARTPTLASLQQEAAAASLLCVHMAAATTPVQDAWGRAHLPHGGVPAALAAARQPEQRVAGRAVPPGAQPRVAAARGHEGERLPGRRRDAPRRGVPSHVSLVLDRALQVPQQPGLQVGVPPRLGLRGPEQSRAQHGHVDGGERQALRVPLLGRSRVPARRALHGRVRGVVPHSPRDQAGERCFMPAQAHGRLASCGGPPSLAPSCCGGRVHPGVSPSATWALSLSLQKWLYERCKPANITGLNSFGGWNRDSISNNVFMAEIAFWLSPEVRARGAPMSSLTTPARYLGVTLLAGASSSQRHATST